MAKTLNHKLSFIQRLLSIGLCGFAFYMLISDKGYHNFPFIVGMIPACIINLIFGFLVQKDRIDEVIKR